MKIHLDGPKGREALKRGFDFGASYTNPTLGPAGKAVVLGRIDLPPKLADDAISIIMNVECENESEQEAIMIMRESAANTSKKMKDSTATTLCLTQAIYSAVFNELEDSDSLVRNSQKNTIQLKKELDVVCADICSKLRLKSRKCEKEDIYKVALSAGTYEWIAKLVTDVFDNIGADGHVEVKEGLKTKYEIIKGLDLSAGFHSDYYINNDEGQCVLKKPKIYVTNQPIQSVTHVLPLMQGITKEDGLILIAPDFSRDVLSRLNTTLLKSGVSIVALKLPTFDKDDLLIDIAIMTGAVFSDRKLFPNYEDFEKSINSSLLGVVAEAVITESSTKLTGAEGNTEDRVAEIKRQIEQSQSYFDKDILEKRLASLSGGTAVITVGGETDFEKEYFKLKVENAIGSVQNALKEGIIRGGGVTLKEISEEMEPNLISKAICAPYETIQKNNGSPFEVKSDVFDATANIIGAVSHACSTAGSLLLSEGVISFKRDEPKN